MFIRQLILAFLGVCFGILVSGGVFTVLLSVGLIPRFAGKTHTNRKVFLYEEMVVAGTMLGNVMSLFPQCEGFGGMMLSLMPRAVVWRAAGQVLLLCYGLFAGMFVGSLAMAIAEMLDSIPILARRTKFRHGLGVMVTAMAFGKAAGSLFYFASGLYNVIK